MAQLSGLFDSFDNLDQIDINSLLIWLKGVPIVSVQLENYLANKILYPTTVPITAIDMKIDLAILREALRLNGPKIGNSEESFLGDNPFLNTTLRKIIIPEKFLSFVPDLINLTWAFVDGLLLNRKKKDLYEDLWTVVLSGESDEIVGSVLLPEFSSLGENLNIVLHSENYQIKAGSLTRINCSKPRCEIAYTITSGNILGKNAGAIELYGGKLGLMIDGRMS